MYNIKVDIIKGYKFCKNIEGHSNHSNNIAYQLHIDCLS